LKKTIITTCAFVLLLLVYGGITSDWGLVYYISGGLGLICIGIALFTYFDKLILGDKGRFLSNKERKDKRTEDVKRYLAASGVILVAAIIGFLLNSLRE